MSTISAKCAIESTQEKLQRLLATARFNRLAEQMATHGHIPPPALNAVEVPVPAPSHTHKCIATEITSQSDRHGEAITYNEQQQAFVNLAASGKSCILMGAAGTGKTTCMRGTLTTLIQNGRAGLLSGDGHKHLPPSGAPGIVVIAFTRRAVANIRKNLPEDLRHNCLTYHALMEYQPEYFTVTDTNTGEDRMTMQFVPARNKFNPLPPSIRICVIEEASMFSTDYFNLLKEVLPSNVQFIFLGDIQQLPPVFGSAVLGYKMLEIETVELTTVYRQALESPIIRLAHRVLSGVPIHETEYPDWKFDGQLTIHPWKKKLAEDYACNELAKFLKRAIDTNNYNPLEDMVLIPYNKACGSIELNKHVAQHLARKRNSLVYEVAAGFNKLYLSVGDKVLFDKEDAIITEISVNLTYTGARVQPASYTLDYWGFDGGATPEIAADTDTDLDFILSQSLAIGAAEDKDEPRVRQASHIVTIKMADSEEKVQLTTAADLNLLLHAYVLTVHKSQGSEFNKVFLLLHNSHATAIQRELLYTAITRAKKELYIICEPNTFTKGILNQRIKGNTLAEKAEYFKGKMSSQGM